MRSALLLFLLLFFFLLCLSEPKTILRDVARAVGARRRRASLDGVGGPGLRSFVHSFTTSQDQPHLGVRVLGAASKSVCFI